MTIPVSSITDTTPGVYKLTGPCSMAAPCGDECPEHGRAPVVTVEPIQWDVTADGVRLGSVILGRSDTCVRYYAYSKQSRIVGDYPTQADAVAAVLAHAADPKPCPTCGQAVSA